jgi:hypothetical protein
MKENGIASSKIIVALLLILFLAGGVGYALSPSKNQGYAPVQPIPFSHKLHAGKYAIDCRYCHTSVEKSRHATVPPEQVCLNCHSAVKLDSPHIQNLKNHFDQGKPIPWIKVHDLPDFTFFNHRRHIDRGVKCQTCHGEVQEMDRVKQFAPLTMGWCVNCHRQPQYNAPVSCDTCHR